MAHTKLLIVHSEALQAGLRKYMQSGAAIHPMLACALMKALHEYRTDDAADLAGLPPDAHVIGQTMDEAGHVSLVMESASFPWTPDGLPFDKMTRFAAVQPGSPSLASPAAAGASSAPAPAGSPAQELVAVAAVQPLSGSAAAVTEEGPAH